MRFRRVFNEQVHKVLGKGIGLLERKLKALLARKLKVLFGHITKLPLYIFSLPIVILVRLISPWYLVRFGSLISSRIGHLAANTEMYLCEKEEGINVPVRSYIDIFFLADKPFCNEQLAKMWKRTLRIWPAWVLAPVNSINGILPGGAKHQIGHNTQNDRDVHNLLDRYPVHLKFTLEEENIGLANLNLMGIDSGTPFVCFLVRDKEYLDKQMPGNDWSYHSHRDCSIENFLLAAEELVKRGYVVIRMGAKVGKGFPTENSRIIDYATNGMRTDFMDIYLGAKCSFCVSTGAGWDAVPSWLFRKPAVFTNLVPLGYIPTFRHDFIIISKKHIDLSTNQELSLSQIFNRGLGYCMSAREYEGQNVKLIENSQEEIRDAVLEMEERITGNRTTNENDLHLQNRFRKLFPVNAIDNRGIQLHGKISASFSAKYLQNNQDWLK